ncbi:MAG: Na(+)-translocating NADH-quinone reductase subunit A [Bacteroides sp.]|nr:Na(+)-translocating NADH-quinone reductase subunit A [Bacteroides sp.]MCM1085383.1 Na(+)-translocating NADH-quinone reductase subunit A [Bacteroides sp.]
MEKIIKLRKGLDIKIEGVPDHSLNAPTVAYVKYAVKPTDFYGMQPKLDVAENDRVQAGTPLFHDKKNPRITVSSPVSGTVREIVYGERRAIREIRIDADEKIEYKQFEPIKPENFTGENVRERLLEAGLWAYIRQRPYDIPANPDTRPRSIHISAFDTAPLAPDLDIVVHGQENFFQAGIDALNKLTDGKVYLGVHRTKTASKVYNECRNVERCVFEGVHPCGNVGVQIHHIQPINKGETVWYVHPQDVVIMGRLFLKGVYDATKIVSLGGSEVVHTGYHKVLAGLNVQYLLKDNLKESELEPRVVSGNVLTGTSVGVNGYLGAYDHGISVIPEGRRFRFMGWMTLGFNLYSYSHTFFSWLFRQRRYRIDTNLNGGERAFVLTGQFEKVLPMDIYPMQLIKACLAEDIEKMEDLGIYEVSPEDFALCEYIDASKTEIQRIIRKGLELVRKEVD